MCEGQQQGARTRWWAVGVCLGAHSILRRCPRPTQDVTLHVVTWHGMGLHQVRCDTLRPEPAMHHPRRAAATAVRLFRTFAAARRTTGYAPRATRRNPHHTS